MIITQVGFSDWWDWLQSSGSYKNNFSYEGAVAVYNYMHQLSESSENQMLDFDPVAWCCEWTEYDSLADIHDQYGDTEATLDHFRDYTTVLEVSNGHIIMQDF